MKRYFPKLIIILLVLLPGVAGTAAGAGAPRSEDVRVTTVFDGDTILVELGGGEVTVRLIGVDTPEVSRPDTPVQFYGPEASAFTRRVLEGTRVTLEFEEPGRPGGSVDRYGRTLAYVITEDGANFNRELVRQGYGRVFAKYPFRHLREFRQAEREARTAGLGIWNSGKRAEWADPAARGRVIGNSRSRIYHLPGQEGYDNVREKNRIYFPNEEEARKAGFRKARN